MTSTYFTLKTSNGKTIKVSESYKTKAGRNKGVASVKANASIAPIKDLTLSYR